MRSIEFNIGFLENALQEMETYLLQPELFWPLSTPVGIRPDFPRLTIANLYLSLNELEAQARKMAPAQYSRTSNLKAEWEKLHNRWRTAVESKSVDEMSARLNLWKAYILDLEENKGRRSNYDQEVTQRVRFALLRARVDAAVIPDELIDLIEAVDSRALALTTPAAFVWDEPLQLIYSKQEYAFLYRKPKEHF